MSLRNFSTAKTRREYLSSELNVDISSLENTPLEENPDVHCENLIGGTQIPLGVAGPLLVLHGNSKEMTYIPMATTEGALVASTSRGSKAVTQSGGARIIVSRKGQTRGPVFVTGSIENGIKLQEWIEENSALLARVAAQTSAHIRYRSAKIKVIGGSVYVRFSYDTQDAMGMNMVTIATEALAAFIEKETDAKCIAVAGNFDIDKKSAWLNVIEGRGFEVWAECIVPATILKDVLHTNAQSVYDTWLSKCMIGSYASGSLGYNAHFANIIAAVFIATGQDPAHVVEGSCGITTCEVRGNDLYMAINIPSLLVGTVGGGTVLPAQKAALSIMGIHEKTPSEKLAVRISGAVLAGELSLLASLTTRTLGQAHEKLGRKKA